MMSARYEAIIFWSPDDEAYLALVPDLPGCLTHGDTREEAVRMAENAIEGWLSVARESGDPVPEPKDRTLAQMKAEWEAARVAGRCIRLRPSSP